MGEGDGDGGGTCLLNGHDFYSIAFGAAAPATRHLDALSANFTPRKEEINTKKKQHSSTRSSRSRSKRRVIPTMSLVFSKKLNFPLGTQRPEFKAF